MAFVELPSNFVVSSPVSDAVLQTTENGKMGNPGGGAAAATSLFGVIFMSHFMINLNSLKTL